MNRTMIKVGQSNNTNLKKNIKQMKARQLNKIVKYSSQNNGNSQNLLGNDILVSLSGQAKIGHLYSCCELEKQDFIVF